MAAVISPYSSPTLLIINRYLCCTRAPESHQIISNHTWGIQMKHTALTCIREDVGKTVW